ncbi:MAG: TFIIB-type zinc ribbon-containing protein [Clostridia bacterium]
MDTFEISIPTDKDGFILLQCCLCGGFFKLSASDINNESIINIWCPYCGLNGKNYYTQEVIDIAMKMVKNEMQKMVYDSFKDLEEKTKNDKFITFTSGIEPKKEIISPIKSKVNNLVIKSYKCCKVKAKVTPISSEVGSYCPLCGGADF